MQSTSSVKSAPSSDENNVSIPRHPPSLLALSAHGLPLLPANLVDAVILAPGKPQHGSWQTHALAAAPEILAHQGQFICSLTAGHSLTCCRLRWARRSWVLSPTVSCCRNAFACLPLLPPDTALLCVCSCLGAFAARGEPRSCRLERYSAEEEGARAPTLLW